MPKSKIIKYDVIKNDDNDVKNNSLNKKIIKIQEKKIELVTQQFIKNNTFILND
jgi:hypothetical protein